MPSIDNSDYKCIILIRNIKTIILVLICRAALGRDIRIVFYHSLCGLAFG